MKLASLLPSLFILMSGALFSQGTLQFNQALFLQTNSTQTFTVPVGKVWKINTITADWNSGSGIMTVVINGATYNNTPKYASDQARFQLSYPLWFPAGTQISLSSSGSSWRFISGIEFNVIP
jgi:hypothetical protein